jgi:hypothetical protein
VETKQNVTWWPETKRAVVRVGFVPKQDSHFARVEAHYTVELESELVRESTAHFAARTALEKVGAFQAYSDAWSWGIQVLAVDWPVTLIDIWTNEAHADALKDDARRFAEQGKVAREKEFVAALTAKMAGWSLLGQRVNVRYNRFDDDVEVPGVQRFIPGNAWSRPRHETMVRTKHFRRGKTGDFNWDAIRKTVEEIADYRAEEVKLEKQRIAAEQAQASGRDEADKMKAAAGLESVPGVSVEPNGVRVTVLCQTEADLIAVRDALRSLGFLGGKEAGK